MVLADSHFLFIDCQTTGLTAEKAEIIELGWSFSFDQEEIQTRLIRPVRLESIPKKVLTMTGINEKELESAESAEIIWKQFRDAVEAAPVPLTAIVIHYAAFETRFLNHLRKEFGDSPVFALPTFCTYQIAKKLYPELPAQTLRALGGHFDFSLSEKTRAFDHTLATQKIWSKLLNELKEQSIHTVEDLLSWKSRKAKKRKISRKYLVERETRLGFPEGPGIYEMHSRSGKILYIGKATCLNSRVNSYFRQKHSKRSRINELMAQVVEVKVRQTQTPLEAALLESDRIKEIEPPYNHSLKSNSRKILFLSPQLEDISPVYEFKHPVGPFTHDQPFNGLERLLHAQKGEWEELDPFTMKHTPEELKDAVETRLSALGYDLSNLNLLKLLRAGKKIQLTPRFSNEVTDEITEEVEESSEESVERKLSNAVRSVHEKQWICWLMESRVLWKLDTGDFRFLLLQNGKITESGFIKSPELLEPLKRKRSPLQNRKLRIDLKTYDRMRILMSELSMFARRGIEIQVQFSPTRTYATTPNGSPSWCTRTLNRERNH